VQDNFKKLLRVLVEGGAYVGIATHDDDLLKDAENYVKEKNLNREDYEFQMLLGVKENTRKELIARGHRMRVYVPFGEDWYGYSSRRLKENPKMVNHIIKSIFTGD
jgi:proline dehydrogenase